MRRIISPVRLVHHDGRDPVDPHLGCPPVDQLIVAVERPEAIRRLFARRGEQPPEPGIERDPPTRLDVLLPHRGDQPGKRPERRDHVHAVASEVVDDPADGVGLGVGKELARQDDAGRGGMPDIPDQAVPLAHRRRLVAVRGGLAGGGLDGAGGVAGPAGMVDALLAERRPRGEQGGLQRRRPGLVWPDVHEHPAVRNPEVVGLRALVGHARSLLILRRSRQSSAGPPGARVGGMSIEIRNASPDDYEAAVDVMTTAFLERPDNRAVAESLRANWDPDRVWLAFDADRVVGTFRSWATDLTVPGGGSLPASAVSAVTVLPTHRRRGIMTGLAAREHGALRERGEAVALLYAAEYGIYGRLGYAPGTRQVDYAVDTRATGFLGEPAGTVELAPVNAATRDAAAAVYEAWRLRQPGELRRRDTSLGPSVRAGRRAVGRALEGLGRAAPGRPRCGRWVRPLEGGGEVGPGRSRVRRRGQRAPRPGQTPLVTTSSGSCSGWICWRRSSCPTGASRSGSHGCSRTRGRAGSRSRRRSLGPAVRRAARPRGAHVRAPGKPRARRRGRPGLGWHDAPLLDAGPDGATCRRTRRSPISPCRSRRCRGPISAGRAWRTSP